MYVLDSNVISAIANDDTVVLTWMLQRQSGEVFACAVSEAEMLAGLAVLPAGRRKMELADRVTSVFRHVFAERVLPFDRTAAEAYGEVFGSRRRSHRPTNQPLDLMIAAIARVHGAAVVTRNTSDFDHCGVTVINPWIA